MRTVLHQAAEQGDIEFIKKILSYDLDVDSRDEDGHCPLMIAIQNEHYEAAIALIKGGADVNISSGGIFACPLHVAIVRQHLGLVEALVESGANLNSRD